MVKEREVTLLGATPDRLLGPDEPDERAQLTIDETMVLARIVSARAFALHRAGLIDNAVPADGHEGAQADSAVAMPRGRTIVYPYYRSLAAALAYGITPYDLFLAFFAQEDDPASSTPRPSRRLPNAAAMKSTPRPTGRRRRPT